MTSKNQMEAFRHRAYLEGDWTTWHQIQQAERVAAADRAARRRARLDAVRGLPPAVLTGAGVLVAVAVVGGSWWLLLHPLVAAALGGVAAAGAGLALWSWLRSRRVVRPLPVAPAAVVAGTVSAVSTLDMPLSGLARALVDGLPATRRRLYLDALSRGLIGAPDEVRTETGRVIRAQLPGGQIGPEDIDIARLGQTLGLHPDQVRRADDPPAGLLMLEILDVRPRDRAAGPWPHQGSRTDFGEPVSLGVDDRGRPISVDLAGRRLLVVGQTGSGKTSFMRMQALYALADPRVTLDVIDLKGSPANFALEAHAAFFHVGAPDARLRARLESLRDELRDRYQGFRAGEDVITARGWRVLWIDESQMLWREPWAVELVEELARLGREAGLGLILGTQLADSKSLPTPILGQCDARVMLRAPEPWMQQLVLSQQVPDGGALPAGHGWLWDCGQVTRLVTHHVTDDLAAAHLATVHRPALPGGLHLVAAAPGTDERTDDDEDHALLCRVRDAIGDRPGLPWADLADELGWDRDELRDELRGLGVASESVRTGPTSTLRGARREAVLAALAG